MPKVLGVPTRTTYLSGPEEAPPLPATIVRF